MRIELDANPADEAAENAMGDEAAPEESEIEGSSEGEPGGEEEGDSKEDDEKADLPKGVTKRLNKITWQREEAKRLAESEKARADRLQAVLDKMLDSEKKPEPKKEPEPKKPNGKPRAQDFDNDEDFFDALTDWKIEQREAAVEQKRAEKAKADELTNRQKAFVSRRDEVNTAGIDKYDDYEQIVFSLPGEVMNVQLAEALFETENAHDIAYYLGKNPEEAAKIAKMSVRKQAIALGKLDAKLSSTPAAPAKKTSNAPPPLKPLKGKAEKKINIDELSVDEFIRLRNEGKI